MNTITTIESVMREVFDVPSISLTRSTSAADVLEWDSLNHVRMIVAVEQELGIRLPMGKVSELKDVGELVDLVEETLG